MWDTASATAIQTLRGHEGHVRTLAYSPDGRRLVTGGDDRAVKVWDAATGSELISIDLGDVVTRVAFSADGRAVVAGCVDGTVRTFESSPTDAAEEPR